MHEPSKPTNRSELPLRAFALVGIVLVILVIAGFLKEERREWKSHQESFRDLEVARAVTVEGREAAATRPLELRQIVVDSLDAVDRCVSCHLAVDDPTYSGTESPFAYHPDHDVHAFERFGCTVCHQGQGRATTAEEAHGNVPFWEEPMLPLEFIEASCGRCHEAADNPAAPRLAQGAFLFEEAGCRGCHRLDGWGGQAGPDLDDRSAAHVRRPEWLVQHFLDPSQLVADSAMPKYGFTEDEARDLTLFVLSRQIEPVSGYHASKRILQSSQLGSRIFREKGCIGCHSLGGYGGDVGPELDDVAERRSETWLLEHFQDPQVVTPGSVMPQFDFSEAEARSLVLFLTAVAEEGMQGLWSQVERSPEERGEVLFKRYGCRGCHGEAGNGGVPNRNSESDEQVPAVKYVKEGYTIAELKSHIRNGVPVVGKLDPDGPEPPLTMAAFGSRLSEPQLDDLVAYLLSLYPEDEALDW